MEEGIVLLSAGLSNVQPSKAKLRLSLFRCFVVLLFCCFVVLLFCCFVVLLFCCFVVYFVIG